MTTMRRALPWAVGVLVLGTACRTNDVPTTPAASKPLASVARERLALPYAGFRGFTHAGKGAGTFVVAPPSGNVVYNTIPTPYPGSFASMGFEATSAAEFGDRILLGGTDRILNTVVVSLDSWACENDFSGGPGTWTPNRASDQDCVTTPGASFPHPVTLNIYAVDNSGPDPAVGALLATQTMTANIPFRPSTAAPCPNGASDIPFGGSWFDPVLGECVHGYAFNVSFDLSSLNVTLPGEVIVSVAYNTADYGAAPIHLAGPYNSLNVSVDPAPATVGSDPNGDEVFWNTTYAGFYCDGGAAGTGTFRRDFGVGCWIGYTPVMTLTAHSPKTIVIGPSSMEGAIKIANGDWVNAGYSLKSKVTGTLTVDGKVTISGPCSTGGSDMITIPLAQMVYNNPAGAKDWLPTGDANSPASWQGAVQVTGLCGGLGKLDASKGAVFTASVLASPAQPGATVTFRFKYRDPAAKGKANTDCRTTDPKRKADVCGASWSQTVTQDP